MMLSAKLWLALGLFLAGAALGGGGAWVAQGWRLDALQARFDGFVATAKAEGEAAKKAADKQAAADKLKKEQSDHAYETTITSLRADVKRMRDARANSGFVPPAAPGARRPDLACFDRAELGRAIRDFDTSLQGLIDEGDAATVGLNTAKAWVK